MNAIMARGDLAGSAGGGIDSKISSFAMTAGYATHTRTYTLSPFQEQAELLHDLLLKIPVSCWCVAAVSAPHWR